MACKGLGLGKASGRRRSGSWRPLRVLGDLSFAVYVLHMPISRYYLIARRGIGVTASFQNKDELLHEFTDLHPAEFLSVAAIVYTLSWIAYRFIEAPCRKRIYSLLAARPPSS